MKIRCPRCQQKLSIADKFAGKAVRCPGCNRVFNVPRPQSATEVLADKQELDLEGLASLEQQASELDARELKEVEKARVEKTRAAKPDPLLRTCPVCSKQTRAHDLYSEILCSHCWNPIPGHERDITDMDVQARLATRSQIGFYSGLVSCLTYPFPAITSILIAAGVAFGAGVIPLVVMTSLSSLMEQSNYGYSKDVGATDLSRMSLILMGTFATEVFFFSAVAMHTFLDVIRTTSVGTEKPPDLVWNPSQWGKSFGGYLALAVYYVAAACLVLSITREGGISTLWSTRNVASTVESGGTSFIIGMTIVSLGIPMNFLGLALGTVIQAVNPVRVAKSVARTNAHYVFLFLLVCVYGIAFGASFWSIVHDWFVPQIELMARGAKEGSIAQVATGLLAWGVVMSLYFYGAFVLGRLHGLFARSFRRQLDFGTM